MNQAKTTKLIITRTTVTHLYVRAVEGGDPPIGRRSARGWGFGLEWDELYAIIDNGLIAYRPHDDQYIKGRRFTYRHPMEIQDDVYGH